MAMAMAMAAMAGTLIPPPLLPLPRPRSLNPRTTSPPRLHRLAVAASGGGDGGPQASEGRPPSLPPLKDIRWGELLAPQPANAAAVALTAALTWAGASLLLQLVLISASIFAAAVKYSFVAALLLFVLIALL